MRTWVILGALLVSCAHKPVSRFKHGNEVSVLGSMHGYMLNNPNYTLHDFAAAIAAFTPDLILTEVRPEHTGPIEGSIDGGTEQSLVYAMANELGAQVEATDWFTNDFIKGSLAEESRLTSEQKTKGEAFLKNYEAEAGRLSLLQLNAPAFSQKLKDFYASLEQNGLTHSRERNEQICMNIREALSRHSASRVLIVFGLDHKFFIETCVRGIAGQQLLEVAEWYKPEFAKHYRLPIAVKNKTTESILGAEALLDQRLEANYYEGELKTRFKGKLANYKKWIHAVDRL